VGVSRGNYIVAGIPKEDGLSLELVARVSCTTWGDPGLSMAGHELWCKSASVSRLQAPSMGYPGTHIKAEDTASITIACDSIAFDDSSVFDTGQGSAAITFTGLNDGPAPFDFANKTYPKGLFNFITTEGANNSMFKFRGTGDAWQRNKLVEDGVITVNGMPTTQPYIGFMYDSQSGYYLFYLRKQ